MRDQSPSMPMMDLSGQIVMRAVAGGGTHLNREGMEDVVEMVDLSVLHLCASKTNLMIAG